MGVQPRPRATLSRSRTAGLDLGHFRFLAFRAGSLLAQAPGGCYFGRRAEDSLTPFRPPREQGVGPQGRVPVSASSPGGREKMLSGFPVEAP